MLRIFNRLWQVNWAEQWQYRANMMMYLLYELISPVLFLSVWRAVTASQGTVKGLTANDFTIYYLTLLVVNKLTNDITIHILAYKIQDGTLSNELLRPVHPILTNTLVYNLAFKALTLLPLAPIWLAMVALFRPDFSSITAPDLLMAVPAVAAGFITNFLLGSIVTCVAFWTTRVYALSEFLYAIAMLLGGTFVPLELLPPVAQKIAHLLPFQLFLYFPIQLVLGRLSPVEIWSGYALQAFWLALMALGFRLIWRAGVRQFSAVGA